MRFHGNYCGQNWSAGKVQTSVVSDVPAIDDFDETCKQHDAAYATNRDLLDADLKFASANIGRGAKRSVAALAVGGQAAIRALDKFYPTIYKTKEEMTKNLRGSKPKTNGGKTPSRATAQQKNKNRITSREVPAATGYQMSQFNANVRRTGTTTVVVGREYGATVSVANSSTFGVSGMVPVSPAFFQSATLGTHAKCNELFRFKKVTVHYVPAVPTSTQGQILLLSSKCINEPFINSAASSFLARGMSQSNAVLTPIWQTCTTTIGCDSAWRNVDCFTDEDLNDNILEEVQVYGWSDFSGTAGSIIIDYECEFKDPIYQPHSTIIPDITGPCSLLVFADDTAANSIGDAFSLTQSTLWTNYGSGTIVRMVFCQTLSTLPTGPATWGAVNNIVSATGASTTSSTSTAVAIAMSEGTTVYGVIRAGTIAVYGSLATAKSSVFNGLITYQTATTVKGSYSFLVHLASAPPQSFLTTQ